MFESYTGASNVFIDGVRTLFSVLDRAAFGLLEFFYQLFFNVASADLFSNDTIMRFYGRVQLIIGVYMMFLLAMTILKGIMNPDTFIGGKDGGGASKLITRVITALIMLTVLVPINIGSPRNEYEIQIHNNGLLFGTLYSLQHRILANNTLGRLILGNDSTSNSYFSSEGEDTLKQSSRIFTSTVLKGFYRINLIDEDDRPKHEDGKDDAIFNENRVCQDIDDEILAAYTRLDAKPGDIIGMVNITCEVDDGSMNLLEKAISIFSPKLAGKQRYVFTFMPLISTITAFIFAIILLSFTVDVAVRAVKLAVLRLIAPIPIISYMDPKGTKDSSFNAWVKALTSTYLDLFIRLAVVYFVIFLIQDMIVNGVVINHGDGLVGILSLIIIWIGLFAFAKQAPKFIKEVLGMKGDAGNLFSGFASIGTAAGVIGTGAGIAAAIPGAIGSGIASARASRLADETRQSFGQKDIFGRDINPNSVGNRAKHIISGIAGGITGGVTGMRAAGTAKDHAFNASLEAMRKRNVDALDRGNSGSTLFGRLQSTGRTITRGEGLSSETERTINSNKGRIDALKAIQSRVKGEMVKADWTQGSLGIAQDNSGNAIGNVNYKSFSSRLAEGRSRGDGLVHFEDVNGVTHEISLADAERQIGFLQKNNEDDYITLNVPGNTASASRAGYKADSRLVTLIHNAEILGGPSGGSSDFVRNADGSITKGGNKHITDRDSVWSAIDGFEDYNTQLNRQNAVNKANDRFSGGKK